MKVLALVFCFAMLASLAVPAVADGKYYCTTEANCPSADSRSGRGRHCRPRMSKLFAWLICRACTIMLVLNMDFVQMAVLALSRCPQMLQIVAHLINLGAFHTPQMARVSFDALSLEWSTSM